MNRAEIVRLAWYGFAIYAVVFMYWSLLGAYGLLYGSVPQAGSLVLTAVAAFLAARATRYSSWKQLLSAGAAWALVCAALDVVYIARTAGFESLATPFIFAGYAIVLLSPLLVLVVKRRTSLSS